MLLHSTISSCISSCLFSFPFSVFFLHSLTNQLILLFSFTYPTIWRFLPSFLRFAPLLYYFPFHSSIYPSILSLSSLFSDSSFHLAISSPYSLICTSITRFPPLFSIFPLVPLFPSCHLATYFIHLLRFPGLRRRTRRHTSHMQRPPSNTRTATSHRTQRTSQKAARGRSYLHCTGMGRSVQQRKGTPNQGPF